MNNEINPHKLIDELLSTFFNNSSGGFMPRFYQIVFPNQQIEILCISVSRLLKIHLSPLEVSSSRLYKTLLLLPLFLTAPLWCESLIMSLDWKGFKENLSGWSNETCYAFH